MKIAVIGAGNFGTAMAFAMSKNNHEIVVYDIVQSRIDDINQNHRNSEVFPNLVLPNNISAKACFDEYLKECSLVCVAVSSSVLPLVLSQLSVFLTAENVILNLSKGFEKSTGLTLEKIYFEKLGKDIFFGVGSGPNFASEIVAGDISAMTVATHSDKVFEAVSQAISSDIFFIQRSTDIVGVEICGAVKNVMAIAAGIHSGLGLGYNSKFTLLTKALQEIACLIKAAGGQPETVMSLAGVGDLLMTATSQNSRNFTFGSYLGQGSNVEQALYKVGSTVEGLDAIKPALMLAKSLDIRMPLVEAVFDIVYNQQEARSSILKVLSN